MGDGPLPPVILQIQAYGVWYSDSYKGGFAQGTSLGFEMICPRRSKALALSLEGFTCLP